MKQHKISFKKLMKTQKLVKTEIVPLFVDGEKWTVTVRTYQKKESK